MKKKSLGEKLKREKGKNRERTRERLRRRERQGERFERENESKTRDSVALEYWIKCSRSFRK